MTADTDRFVHLNAQNALLHAFQSDSAEQAMRALDAGADPFEPSQEAHEPAPIVRAISWRAKHAFDAVAERLAGEGRWNSMARVDLTETLLESALRAGHADFIRTTVLLVDWARADELGRRPLFVALHSGRANRILTRIGLRADPDPLGALPPGEPDPTGLGLWDVVLRRYSRAHASAMAPLIEELGLWALEQAEPSDPARVATLCRWIGLVHAQLEASAGAAGSAQPPVAFAPWREAWAAREARALGEAVSAASPKAEKSEAAKAPAKGAPRL
jgi:hypothetical protein